MDQLADLLEKERKTKALSSKNNSTRHSRFGTTIQVKAVSGLSLPSARNTGLPADGTKGDQKLILHKQNGIHVNPGKILDEGKKKRAKPVKHTVSCTEFEEEPKLTLPGRTDCTGPS